MSIPFKMAFILIHDRVDEIESEFHHEKINGFGQHCLKTTIVYAWDFTFQTMVDKRYSSDFTSTNIEFWVPANSGPGVRATGNGDGKSIPASWTVAKLSLGLQGKLCDTDSAWRQQVDDLAQNCTREIPIHLT